MSRQQFPMPALAVGCGPLYRACHSVLRKSETDYTARDISAYFTAAAQNTTALVFPNVFPVSRESPACSFSPAVNSGQSVLDTGVRGAYFRRIHSVR
jgi:hypothetical protein